MLADSLENRGSTRQTERNYKTRAEIGGYTSVSVGGIFFRGGSFFLKKKIKFWLGTTERGAELLCSRREISLERRQLPRHPLV